MATSEFNAARRRSGGTLESEPFGDAATTIAGAASNLGTGQAFLAQRVHLLEDQFARLLMGKTHPAAMDRGIGNVIIGEESSSRRASRKAHLLLNRHAQILDEMESVGDLQRLRCALASGLRVQAAAISADDLDRWMLL